MSQQGPGDGPKQGGDVDLGNKKWILFDSISVTSKTLFLSVKTGFPPIIIEDHGNNKHGSMSGSVIILRIHVCLHYSENYGKSVQWINNGFLCFKMQGTILLLMVGFDWNKVNFVWTTNHSDPSSLFRLNPVKHQCNVEQL